MPCANRFQLNKCCAFVCSTAAGRVTTKVDVYASGIILMELITGRRAIDRTLPVDRSVLEKWFCGFLGNKDNIRKAIDAKIDLDDETFESIYKVAELAGNCVAPEPQRPDMGHAVRVLAPLVEQWKPSSQEVDTDIDSNTSLPRLLERWEANASTSTTIND